MIAVIDYDAGNLKSVEKALHHIGQESLVTRDAKELLAADQVILPGVGAFGVAMAHLKKYELDRVIEEIVQKGTPFLGICLGQHLLFEGSQENSGVEGLGLLEGEIIKIPDSPGLKIPHIGWNSLDLLGDARLFAGVGEHPYVYFVHSYYLRAKEESIVTATAEYGVTIHASIEKGNLFACQFHPEKSSATGLTILQNFAALGGGA